MKKLDDKGVPQIYSWDIRTGHLSALTDHPTEVLEFHVSHESVIYQADLAGPVPDYPMFSVERNRQNAIGLEEGKLQPVRKDWLVRRIVCAEPPLFRSRKHRQTGARGRV